MFESPPVFIFSEARFAVNYAGNYGSNFLRNYLRARELTVDERKVVAENKGGRRQGNAGLAAGGA